MPLAETLTKDEFKALDDSIKGAYVESGNEYVLDLPDELAAEPLRTALTKVRAELKIAKQSATDSKKELDDFLSEIKEGELKDIIKKGDFKKLLQSMNDDRDEFEKKAKERQDKDRAKIAELALGNAVSDVYKELKAKSNTMLDIYLQSQVDVSFDDNGDVQVSYKGAEDVKTFAKSLLDNEDVQGSIVVSNASGSGAAGNNSGGGSSTANDEKKVYGDYASQELIALRKENPEKYNSLLKTRNAYAK